MFKYCFQSFSYLGFGFLFNHDSQPTTVHPFPHRPRALPNSSDRHKTRQEYRARVVRCGPGESGRSGVYILLNITNTMLVHFKTLTARTSTSASKKARPQWGLALPYRSHNAGQRQPSTLCTWQSHGNGKIVMGKWAHRHNEETDELLNLRRPADLARPDPGPTVACQGRNLACKEGPTMELNSEGRNLAPRDAESCS